MPMKYIVAVSGGLDSVVLLHMMDTLHRHGSDLALVVAHVDHGMRHDSDVDAWHVAALARKYGWPLEVKRLSLAKGASEEVARKARYEFLEEVRQRHGADGIATAHHADDLVETIALNIGRGTGWRGLASLRSSIQRYRPLLGVSKASLVQYALEHNLTWREDDTNDDIRYTRNYIRHGITPKLDAASRKKLIELAKKQRTLRRKIEAEVKKVVESLTRSDGLSRHAMIMMPDEAALEVLRHVTRGRHEPFQLRRLLHFVRTGRQGAVLNLGRGNNALLTRTRLIV